MMRYDFEETTMAIKTARKRMRKKEMYLGNGVGGGLQRRLMRSHRSSTVGGGGEASLKSIRVELTGDEDKERKQQAREGRR